VIAADPNIEALVGELVAFAGHRPLFDVTGGAAGESVRRARPDALLLDTALPPAIVRACLAASVEIGSRCILLSSTSSAAELKAQADAVHCSSFTLPGGPRQLCAVVGRALRDHQPAVTVVIPERLRGDREARAVYPAMCAALTSVARAKLRSERVAVVRDATSELRASPRELLDDTRRSRDAMRAAMADYLGLMRGAHVSEGDALIRLRHTIEDCSSIVGADAAIAPLLAESEALTHAVYCAD
jgi:hypothetical protein